MLGEGQNMTNKQIKSNRSPSSDQQGDKVYSHYECIVNGWWGSLSACSLSERLPGISSCTEGQRGEEGGLACDLPTQEGVKQQTVLAERS